MRETTVASAAEAAIAVQGLIASGVTCAGVLCFVRDEPLTGWSRDVMVCSTSNLVGMLLSRPSVLDPAAVQDCTRAVRRRTGRPAKTAQRTGAARRRRGGRPLVALVGMVVRLVALMSGGYQAVAEWAGQRFVEVVAPAEPVEPTPEPNRMEQLRDERQRQE